MISKNYSSIFAIGIIALILTIFEIIAFHTFINKSINSNLKGAENSILNKSLNLILPKYNKNEDIVQYITYKQNYLKSLYLRHKKSKYNSSVYTFCELYQQKNNSNEDFSLSNSIFSEKINELRHICKKYPLFLKYYDSDGIDYLLKNKLYIEENIKTILIKDKQIYERFIYLFKKIIRKINKFNGIFDFNHNNSSLQIKIKPIYEKLFNELSKNITNKELVLKNYLPNEYQNKKFDHILNELYTTFLNKIDNIYSIYNEDIIDELYNTMMDTLEKNKNNNKNNIVFKIPIVFYNKMQDFVKIMESNEIYYINHINNKYIHMNSVVILLIICGFIFFIYHLIKVYQLQNHIKKFSKAIDTNIIYSILITIILIILFQIYFFKTVMQKYKVNSNGFNNLKNYILENIIDDTQNIYDQQNNIKNSIVKQINKEKEKEKDYIDTYIKKEKEDTTIKINDFNINELNIEENNKNIYNDLITDINKNENTIENKIKNKDNKDNKYNIDNIDSLTDINGNNI